MYSPHSRQMILQEGDPLCWVLLWLACYGRRILGRLEIVCSRGFHEVDEATLHETSSGLIYLAEGRGHRRGEREAREEARPAHCRLGWGLSQASAKLKQDCSVHTMAGVGTLHVDTGVRSWWVAKQGQHCGAHAGGRETTSKSVCDTKAQTRLSGSSWPWGSSRWLSIWDHGDGAWKKRWV